MNSISFNRYYARRGVRMLVHLAFWIIYFYLINAKGLLKGDVRAGLIGSLPVWMPYIFTFYIFAYFVFPKTIYRKKYLTFVTSGLFLFALYLFVDYISCMVAVNIFSADSKYLYTTQYYQNRISGGLLARFTHIGMILTLFFELLYIIAIPLVIKISRDIFILHNKTLQLQKSNLQMELKFLKSQLNPHFLFNTLNNLDSLITLGRNREASLITIKLSEFMRYTLYECNDEFVSLSKEVDLIKNYIQLEKIRHQDLRIETNFQIEKADRLIPPLILLPFLENAFKHGVDLGIPNAKISISLIENELGVIYTIENTTLEFKENKRSGIGLNNAKGRLQYYYPDKHELAIKEENGRHSVHLKIGVL